MADVNDGSARLSGLGERVHAILEPLKGIWQDVGRRLDRFNLDDRFASVTRRIILLNLVGVMIVVVGVLSISRTQAWLVDAKKDALLVQADIIAQAIADTITGEKDRSLIESSFMAGGEDDAAEAAKIDSPQVLRFSLSPERVLPVATKLVKPTGTRARIYDSSGSLLADTKSGLRGIDAEPLPDVDENESSVIQSVWTYISAFLNRSKLPLYRDIGRGNGKAYEEVTKALAGETEPLLLIDEKGKHVVSVAVPIWRIKQVHGVLLLSTQGGEVDKIIWRERRSIMWIALGALAAMLISSFMLARSIAWPLSQLSQAAERVQKNLKLRESLADFTRRTDEIGHLSRTLTDMTTSLYKRIESSERFAADVAHELKNPLTSVRSAAETLTFVKSEADRQQLIGTIQHDVQRLTRLIDDISKATRAEAEMALSEAVPVDLADLLTTVVGVFNDVHVKNGQKVEVDLAGVPLGSNAYVVNGHDLRLGQVFNNLLGNALSFSPPNGTVRVRARRDQSDILVQVDDEGPGIPEGNLERIFERFYTDRPGADSFGKNSGLGLSISREIVLAHRGDIWAENRLEGELQKTGTDDMPRIAGKVAGARFSVRLPAAHPMALPRSPMFRARRK